MSEANILPHAAEAKIKTKTKKRNIMQFDIKTSILQEIDQEAATTRSLLEIIPEDKLDWRPHPKAKSLGELAFHIATSQRGVAELGHDDIAQVNPLPEVSPSNRAEIITAFEESTAKAKEIVAATSEERVFSDWTLMNNGVAVLTIPRIALWRSILLNHTYHHRGQLSTYLRTLNVALPSIYGPTADENPFA